MKVIFYNCWRFKESHGVFMHTYRPETGTQHYAISCRYCHNGDSCEMSTEEHEGFLYLNGEEDANI